ncbi:MAG: zinc-binding dehydrogenase [Bacillati bacterium ANGP1]|uniref:Zinc-binding dehydrogenase n=1 Tax=Candidatus Segetimicrobium genomatis TaxID=2569760 RepID=A0A537IRE5_9BACT|nr:MAG: zinc-binding dehydrogenase [Terrabacteria group bacterium ANGP1]
MMADALEFRHEVARYLATRLTYQLARPLWFARLAPLHRVRRSPPLPTRPGWVRLRVRLSGICGTDVNLVTGRDSLYLEPEASYPFVPGHELVAEVDADGLRPDVADSPLQAGTRCAVWPVLGCRARGVAEPCRPCREGWEGMCERRGDEWPGRGIGIGFNCETGGGWSHACLAHRSQLWPLSPRVADEDALLLDPAATALAALLRSEAAEMERTLVIGGGTIGLLIAYLHRVLGRPGSCELLVRHESQRAWAEHHGVAATVVRGASEFRDWASARRMRAVRVIGYGYVFRGVYDRVIDAAGTRSSVTQALQAVRPRGLLVMVAAPPTLAGVDPTPLWYREITLRGVYVYGPVPWKGEWVHPYTVLLPRQEAGTLGLRDLITHTFPLDAYSAAFAALVHRRGSGAIKVAFRPGTAEA